MTTLITACQNTPASTTTAVSAPIPTTPTTPIYHIAPNGDDDTGDGSEAAPWQTIQQCANVAQAGDTCLIHSGTYRETVRPVNSGTAGKPIIFAAADGADTTISSADLLLDWQDGGNGRYTTTIPASLSRGKNQPFLDGEPLLEARHPNQADSDWEYPVNGLSPLWPTRSSFAANAEHSADADQYRISNDNGLLDQPVNAWQNALYVGWHYWGWSAQTGIIANSAPGELNIDPATTSFNWWCTYKLCNASWSPDNGRGMIVGHASALDQPGEWVLDEASNTLTVWLPDGLHPDEHSLELKQRHLAFDLTARDYIELDGLDIFASSITTAQGSHNLLNELTLRYLSHFTQFADGRNGYIDPVPNPSGLQPGDPAVLPRGEVGLYLGGHDNTLQNSAVQFSAGAGVILQGYNQVVHNNLIQECSYAGTYLSCIFVTYDPAIDSELDDYRGRHTISYNTLRDAGRSLIHFNSLPAIAESRDATLQYDALQITHNHIFNGNLLARDTGNVYAWAVSLGRDGDLTEFAYNVIHDSWDESMDIGLVYWDNATFAIDNHNNLLWASTGSQQTDHTFNPPGDERTWRDNTWKANYDGGVAGLTEADFVNGRFPFGHNFEQPPASQPLPTATPRPLTPYIRLQAEDFDDSQGISVDGDRIGQCDAGDWVGFKNIYFADGYTTLRTRLLVPSTNDGQTLEVRLDVPNGRLVGTLTTQAPAEALTFTYQDIPLANVSGTHDVYFVCAGEGRIGVFDWFLFGGGSGPTATPAPQPVNLALNQPASASTFEGSGFEASSAADGRRDTRWASIAFADPQWLLIDLGAAQAIGRVIIFWEVAYARQYQLQAAASPDGPWTDIYTESASNGEIDDIDGLDGNGRYLRIFGNKRGSEWGYSIWEVEVYDPETAVIVPTPKP